MYEHKKKLVPGFTRKYKLSRLVYYEETGDAAAAIAREKQIKGWLRAKKIALIDTLNPRWEDLSEDWYEDEWGVLDMFVEIAWFAQLVL